MKTSELISKGMVIGVLAVFLFAGSSFAGGGFEGGVDLGTGTIEGPEAWAVVTLQCVQESTAVDISLRAKRLEDCNVITDTVVINSLYSFDGEEGESCPTDVNMLSDILLYYAFPVAANFPPLFNAQLSRPIITKIKNASVEIGDAGLTTISFDAQLKNFTPNPTQ